MLTTLLPLLSLLFLSPDGSSNVANALRMPISKVNLGSRANGGDAWADAIARRSSNPPTYVNISTPKYTASGDDPFGFQSIHGFAYTGVIHVGEEPFTVLLDTGSSDLWLDTHGHNMYGLTDTGVTGQVRYDDGAQVQGKIMAGSVTWGGYSVKDQAFIAAPQNNATLGGSYDGLLGIGPPDLSTIYKTLQDAGSSNGGMTFMDNLFAVYPDQPNYMTFLLSRGQPGISDGGVFTIGDIEPNYTAILEQPQLPVVASRLWVTFMDGLNLGSIYLYSGSSGSILVPHVPPNKTLVNFDTGVSLSAAPKLYVDAMYAQLPGAVFNGKDRYTLPCDTKVHVSLVFGENVYPIHPLDMVVPTHVSDDGVVTCGSGFYYTPSGANVDFTLGGTFLRNVYSLFDFGSWAKVGDTAPFIQILSTTDMDVALAEFDELNEIRLARVIYFHQQSKQSNPTSSSPPANPTHPIFAGNAHNPTSTPTPNDPTTSAPTPGPSTTPIPATPPVSSTLSPNHPETVPTPPTSHDDTSPTPSPSSTGTSSPSPATSTTTSTPSPKDPVTLVGQLSSSDDQDDKSKNTIKFLYIAIGVLGALVLLLLAAVVVLLVRGRGGKVKGGKAYRSLGDPYPAVKYSD